MEEKNLDFDRVVDRYGTNCLKYDFAARRGMPEHLLPLWIADMDFSTSSYVQEALVRQAEHGIYGYSEVQEEYFKILRDWMKGHYDWEVEQRWLVKTPGIVYALSLAIRAFTKPGDGVLLQLPVYYPFSEVIQDNDRKLVSNTLVYDEDGRYHMDFEDFEQKVIQERIQLFFLCNPHNPVGRVWTREELLRLGEICKRHGVIVVSDEIHADFVFQGKHTVFADLSDFIEMTITCTSPSKTFNLAGLQISNIFISNPKLRRAFRKQLNATGYSQLNVMGLVACEAAYEKGETWYQAMYDYVKENIAFTREYVEKQIPSITMMPHEGTYLVWLDFRGLGLSADELEDLVIHKAGLWLDSGAIFGESGAGFQRINVACPRKILKEALERMKKAIDEI